METLDEIMIDQPMVDDQLDEVTGWDEDLAINNDYEESFDRTIEDY